MTANIYDLTTLATLKSYINVGSQDDVLLQRLLTSASIAIESYCNRDFVSLSYTSTFDGNNARYMVLPDYPVTAVSSVTINGVSIPAGSITNAGYYFDGQKIMLFGYIFTRGLGNVVISFTGGYAVIPYDLEQACIGLVQYWLGNRQRNGEVSRSMGGQTISYDRSDMPAWVKTILQQYKRVITF
jgi:uncharacterized phiE125 gp8 family phage protein